MQIHANTDQYIPNTCKILANFNRRTLQVSCPLKLEFARYLHVFVCICMYWVCIGL